MEWIGIAGMSLLVIMFWMGYMAGYDAGRLARGRAEVMPRDMSAEDEPSVAPVQAIRRPGRNTADPERLVEPRPWPAPTVVRGGDVTTVERRYNKMLRDNALAPYKLERGGRS